MENLLRWFISANSSSLTWGSHRTVLDIASLKNYADICNELIRYQKKQIREVMCDKSKLMTTEKFDNITKDPVENHANYHHATVGFWSTLRTTLKASKTRKSEVLSTDKHVSYKKVYNTAVNKLVEFEVFENGKLKLTEKGKGVSEQWIGELKIIIKQP